MSQVKAWVEGIIVFVIVAIVGCGVYGVYRNQIENVELKNTVQEQQYTIKALEKSVKTANEIRQVNDLVTTDTVIEGRKAGTDVAAITQKADEKEEAIRRKYEKMLAAERAKQSAAGATPSEDLNASLQQLENQELSEVRIDSMWQVYCRFEPTHASCITPATPPSS